MSRIEEVNTEKLTSSSVLLGNQNQNADNSTSLFIRND